MKNFKMKSLILLLLLTVAAPVWAQESPVELRLQLLKSSEFPRQRIYTRSEWDRMTTGNRFQVLEETSHRGLLGRDFLGHSGQKFPQGYRDPRTDSYQVQYTDIGLKLDAEVARGQGDYLIVNCRPERSTLWQPVRPDGDRDVVVVESKFMLKRNHTAIIAAIRGVQVPKFLKAAFGSAGFTADDTFLVAIGVR